MRIRIVEEHTDDGVSTLLADYPGEWSYSRFVQRPDGCYRRILSGKAVGRTYRRNADGYLYPTQE